MQQDNKIANIYEAAIKCNDCFERNKELVRPIIDLPQPRWIGPAYHSANRRILVVMLNPGQGVSSQLADNEQAKELLISYRSGSTPLTKLFQYQKSHMHSWGRPKGRFLSFYTSSLGLNIDTLSFVNIALCATKGNSYPSVMLNHCFSKYTASLVNVLQPDVVLLSGTSTYPYESRLKSLLPESLIIPMLHYAHREGKQKEVAELARIRALIPSEN